MPAPMKAGKVLLLIGATVAVVLAIAACGGSDDGSSGSTNLASVAPPDSLFYLEAARPKGKASANLDALAEKIAGIDDLGEFLIFELESSAADSGGEVDFAEEVEPWLGEKAAFFPRSYDGDDFSEGGAALQTTNSGEAEDFLQKRADEAKDPITEASYNGVDYDVDGEDGSAIGVIGDFVAYAEDEPTFEAMVDASEGDSLADDPEFTKALSAAPKDSVANVWVDIGGLVQEGGEEIDPDTETGLSFLGIEPEGATAVASAIPAADQIEIHLSSDVVLDPQPAADTSFLLGSLPTSTVAVSLPEVGQSLAGAIDRLDREGIPDEDIPPGKLKSFFKSAGVDLESIGASITNLAAFLEVGSDLSLGGAAVLITRGPEQSREIINALRRFLRAADVPGITALGGKFTGLSIRNPDLGPQPLVIAADDGIHLVVSYGFKALKRYFSYGEELADMPVFKEAAASLGGAPISGFVEGISGLRLLLNVVSQEDRERLLEARTYLAKIDFLALASESTDELAKAKLVIGIGE
jgi:hypothetical protein